MLTEEKNYDEEKEIEEFIQFLKNSPTAFHAADYFARRLSEQGFEELSERKRWNVCPGGSYFTRRNSSSIIAFRIGTGLEDYSFKIAASHSDSPSFKVKENAELIVRNQYTQLNTEGYGGMLCASWMDRPLSVAGRVILRGREGLKECLLKVDRDLLVIPSVAIHMNRGANEDSSYNKQVDMLPLFSGCPQKRGEGSLKALAAEQLGTDPADILGMDLYLYNRMEPSVWGADEEFISAARLDDLQCAYTSFAGFLKARDSRAVNVFACFDNEEVGSATKQGAGSTFLADVLYRVNGALGRSQEEYRQAAASSFMISCDNAHAVHPNHPEKTDRKNCVYMNQGIVIKSHAGQQYTSDAFSSAVWKHICEEAGVPVQYFANRSDMRGGSTLGNIAMSQVSMNAVDIGLPQLAMHSAWETAGVKDSLFMIRAAETFFNSGIRDYTLS